MKSSKQKRSQVKIFLSHVSHEDSLAEVLKKWIQYAFDKRVTVFVSSAIDDMPAGITWLDRLRKELSGSKALIVLCSPSSVTRPWVLLESGGAWVRKIPIISICHSGQKKENLPPPLSFFQALEISPPSFFPHLLRSLSKQLELGEPLRPDQKLIAEEIKAARKKIKKPVTTRTSGKAIHKPRKKSARVIRNLIILKKIAKTNDEDCTWSKLARALQMDPNELDIHLRYLTNHEFLTRRKIRGGDFLYHTTDKGLDYIVMHKQIARGKEK